MKTLIFAMALLCSGCSVPKRIDANQPPEGKLFPFPSKMRIGKGDWINVDLNQILDFKSVGSSKLSIRHMPDESLKIEAESLYITGKNGNSYEVRSNEELRQVMHKLEAIPGNTKGGAQRGQASAGINRTKGADERTVR